MKNAKVKVTKTEYGNYYGPESIEPLSEEHARKWAEFQKNNPNNEMVVMHKKMRGHLSPLLDKVPDAVYVHPPGDVPVLRNKTTGHEVASPDGTFDLWAYGEPVEFSQPLSKAIEWLKSPS